MKTITAKQKIITRILNNAKGRANDANHTKGRTVSYKLDRAWVEGIIESQGECCPYTGQPYDYDTYKSWHGRAGHPNRPSINRKNPKHGYTKDNCEVCSNWWNSQKASWTTAEVLPFIVGYARRNIWKLIFGK